MDAIGSDVFQELDIVSITRPCTEWSAMVTDINLLPQYINNAFEVATSGRPGPVLLDIPKDSSGATLHLPIHLTNFVSAAEAEASVNCLSQDVNSELQKEITQRCAQLLNRSRRPVIYAGQGVICSPHGISFLRQLVDKACIPITTKLLAIGAFDEFDAKSLHMQVMHGAAYANHAIQKAGLIIALGARFDEQATGNVGKFAPAAKFAATEGKGGIVYFDISIDQISRIFHVTEAVEGNIQESWTDLLPFVGAVAHRPEWLGQIERWKKQYPLFSIGTHYRASANGKVDPQLLIRTLSEMTRRLSDRIIITIGVGQHQMWVAQHYKFGPVRRLITSGGVGTMGFGLPAAIGPELHIRRLL
ncbi:hypothetical protein N7462_010095 [Penicillium macrosclerotiorum]|uniref:uncharacterized protein n=1 Tax=Penicillium macrosclerotiorum TaxID=303699 RepID=UPI00254748A3|nr:uncharacterized protein N7462_010095 [Penicillium macrosclerotiorum]KAJ5669025.1 hypothetical protein N7462_010095 [Penicillium macrosclerotiorum]